MAHSVYALSDSRAPLAPRYVGVTKSRDVAPRLRAHLAEALAAAGTHKRHWMRDAVRRRLALIGRPLVVVDSEAEALRIERELIRRWTARGERLTNACEGGRGVLNPSVRTRRKMSKSHLGRRPSPETRAKMRDAHLGVRVPGRRSRVVTAAFRAKMREVAANRPPVSDETKRKISDARTGTFASQETRMAIARGQKAAWRRLSPEARRSRIQAAASVVKQNGRMPESIRKSWDLRRRRTE